jgi:uncharacterized phage-like protein YoqJ
MRLAITGHRLFKLQAYDTDWIRAAIHSTLADNMDTVSYGDAGMASGVDLWFCEACLDLGIPYAASIPFEAQRDEMGPDERVQRDRLIGLAADVSYVRNSRMVERCDAGMVVWDGNKGGTHNVLQQLVEHGKPFFWINPVGQKLWKCF